MLVKRHEGFRNFWLRRAREWVALPTLTAAERAEVTAEMRRAAWANIDFYTLILLSSTIAILGLIQNSGAVTIGAMLVAPLMSPILAMAHSLVQGDFSLFRRASESAIKGITLSIGVGFVVTLFLPAHYPTEQILSRTEPNILDLVVALASGAAAAYAVSRKQVAAALPGVAIAAALVPPLCVVGYGLGASQIRIAGGALLLFTTNLSAIILAGAVIFFILGFRPLRVQIGGQVRRGILVILASLLVLAIPLSWASLSSGYQIERQSQVQFALKEAMQSDAAQVEDVSVERQGDGFLVSATIYAFDDLSSAEIETVRRELSEAMGAPVNVRFKVVPAALVETGYGGE
jgi:uncharacterized hydrophobic protein (TIGR00271 family)